MTHTATTILIRAALITILTSTIAGQAGAASLGVKLACASDYYALCSRHAVGSPGVRRCMRANGSQLSQKCISALISAGEVSRDEVERRRAARTAKTAAAN